MQTYDSNEWSVRRAAPLIDATGQRLDAIWCGAAISWKSEWRCAGTLATACDVTRICVRCSRRKTLRARARVSI